MVLPGPSVHGILQARVLESVALPSSGDLPHSGIEPASPALAGRFFTSNATWEVPAHQIPGLGGTGWRASSWKDTGGRRPAFLLGPEGQGLWLRRPCVWSPAARPSRRVSPSGSRLQQSICEGLWRQHALQGSQKRVSVHQGGTVGMLPGLVPSPGPWPEHPGARGPTSTPAPAAQGRSYAH